MKRGLYVVLPLLLVCQAVTGQGLSGTWVSNDLLLALVRFSLTFRDDMTYEIDTTMGKTTGTYVVNGNTIIFTPIKVGINGGSIGDTDVYSYTFKDENTLHMKGDGNELTLVRTRPQHMRQAEEPGSPPPQAPETP